MNEMELELEVGVESDISFGLTSAQSAYYLGRNAAAGEQRVSTHGYNEFVWQIDIERFEQALNKVIRRHSMLRAVITSPYEQRVLADPGYYQIKTCDMRACTKKEQDDYIAQRRAVLSHYVCDAGKWPLFEFEAVRISDADVYVMVSADLLIADAASFMLMLKEIFEYYNNPDLQKEPPAAEFKDYVKWIEAAKESPRFKRDKDYWLSRMDTMPHSPQLPALKNVEEKGYRRMIRRIPADKVAGLKEYAVSHNIILTALMCSLYGMVLAKWSGDMEMTLNLTVSNRGRMKGTEQVIGDFTSLMLVSCSLEEEMESAEDAEAASESFLKLAKRMQKSFMEAYMHASYDAFELQGQMARAEENYGEPMFPVVFTSLLESGAPDSDLSFIMDTMRYSISQTPRVYLDCQMSTIGDEIALSWDYPQGRYDAAMMDRMFETFHAMIDALGDGHAEKILQILHREGEEKAAVAQYNRTDAIADEQKVRTLLDIILKAEKLYSDKTAYYDAHSSVSYEMMGCYAAKYAAYLREQGVKAGDCVGVEGQRNVMAVCQIMGIVKAGAAYVPVNPEYPKDRVDYIIEHSECVAYLDSKQDFAFIESYDGYCIEPESLSFETAAYVIYTSGSTGRPKGVQVSHGAVVNTLLSVNRRFGVDSSDKVLCVSSFGFDLSVYDLFGTALAGATAYIATGTRNLTELDHITRKEEITLWNSVPAVLELLVNEWKAEQRSIPHLKAVFLSGDFIPLNLIGKIRQVAPQARIISMGGATEAAIWSIYYEVDSISPAWSSIPYGYPLDGQQCYVLDKGGHLCPHEVVGEICIGGAGLADGYKNSIELTQKQFVVHPMYGRLYHTGDLGRFKREGYIEIIGRMDEQVKINGYRIEQEEIERVLEEAKGVSKAIVNIGNEEGKKRIYAYLRPDKDVDGTDMAHVLERVNGEGLLEPADEMIQKETIAELNRITYDRILLALKNIVDENELSVPFTAAHYLQAAGIPQARREVISRWLFHLADAGWIAEKQGFYQIDSRKVRTIAQIRVDYAAFAEKHAGLHEKYREMFAFYEKCSDNLENVLREESNVLEFLFPGGEMDTADMVYRDNEFADYLNHVTAQGIISYLEEKKDSGVIRILEVGGGVGGTTFELLKQVKDYNVEYTFTDISPYFISQAKEQMKEYPFVRFGIYDINRDHIAQGLEPESFDIVVAANVMHDASDVKGTLCDMERLLKPGGMLAMIEIVKESPLFLMTMQFLTGIENFNDFRREKYTPFLTDREWCEVLGECGYKASLAFPNQESDRVIYLEKCIFAVREARSRYLNGKEIEQVQAYAKAQLPAYMVPKVYIQVESFPENDNGKIIKKQLPLPPVVKVKGEVKPPRTPLEKDIYGIWCRLLDRDDFGIDDDFFEIGGDSLIMIRFLSEYEKNMKEKIRIGVLMENITIEKVASVIEAEKRNEEINQLKTLPECVEFAAERYGSQVAVIEAEKETTYKEILDQTYGFANGIDRYIGKKTAIALIGVSSSEYMVSLMAVLMSGCIAVPIDPKKTLDEIADEIIRADVTAIVYDEQLEHIAAYVNEQTDAIEQFVCYQGSSDALNAISYKEFVSDCTPYTSKAVEDACAIIMYTSGTSGKGKGVMLSNKNILADVKYFLPAYPWTGAKQARGLTLLPVHHITCMICEYVGMCFCAGTPMVVNKVYSKLIGNIRKHEITIMVMVPAIANFILSQLNLYALRNSGLTKEEVRKEVLGPQEFHIVIGGAHSNQKLLDDLRAYGVHAFTGYGQTENASTVATELYQFKQRDGSVGQILPGMEVKIVDGEIWMRGDNVMMGYYKDPENTAEALKDGWLCTGDMGYVDEDGFLYVTGRKKCLIVTSNGENVAPEGLEDQILENNLVREVVVYQLEGSLACQIYPDEIGLERAGINEPQTYFEEYIQTINKNNASYKHIVKVILRDKEFEKNTTNKIRRDLFMKEL